MSASATSDPRYQPAHRRTEQKVRRNSHPAKQKWWKHFSWEKGRRLLLALRVYSEKLRKSGQRTGAAPKKGVVGDKGGISFGAIRLMEVLVAVAARGQGRLEPSAQWLANALNVPTKSIHAWKQQLQRHGFLIWQRRYVETGLQGLRGPQVKQTSNAYVLTMPVAAESAAEAVVSPRPARQSNIERAYANQPELMAKLDRYEDNRNSYQEMIRRGCNPQSPT